MASAGLAGARGSSPLQESVRRRRRVLVGLVVSVFVTLMVALVASQPGAWGVHLVADVLLVAYVAMLIRVRNVLADVEMSARTLGG